jgi:tetratricopeptide (TPR) repeat protein
MFDEEEEYEEYIAAATENIQADASDYASRNNRGVAYLEMGETQAALDDFTAVCQLAPHESSPLLSLASISEERDDLQGALAYATEAIRVEPNNSTCYFVRKSIYQKLGDNTRAEEDHRSGNKHRGAEGYASIK